MAQSNSKHLKTNWTFLIHFTHFFTEGLIGFTFVFPYGTIKYELCANVSVSPVFKFKYVLRMLIEGNQRSFVFRTAGFGLLTFASNSFRIELFVWTARSVRLDRIIQVRRLNTHCRKGEGLTG